MAGNQKNQKLCTVDKEKHLYIIEISDEIVLCEKRKHVTAGKVAYPHKFFLAIQSLDEQAYNDVKEYL